MPGSLPPRPVRLRLLASALTALAGPLLLVSPLGPWLRHLSHDLTYLFRTSSIPDEAVLVLIDEPSLLALRQSPDPPLDRSLHVRLIEALRSRAARAIVFDLLFDQPSADPGVDARLADAIRDAGNVVLAASLAESAAPARGIQETLLLPTPPMVDAAPWGIAEFPRDSDLVIRHHFPPRDRPSEHPSLALQAARRVSAYELPDPAGLAIWHYGPGGSLPALSYHLLLASNAVPAQAVAGKVVFVGQAPVVTTRGQGGADVFSTPFTRWTGRKTPGVEIHATAFLNLVRGESMRRWPPWVESFLLAVLGSLAGFTLSGLRPRQSLWIGLAACPVVGIASIAFEIGAHRIFPWLALAPTQMLTAMACSWWFHLVPVRPRYDAFISYRRGTDVATAQLLQDRLRKHGIRAFLDVTDLGPGPWSEDLLRNIREAPGFLLILSPGAFDRCQDPDDFLRREIETALASRRNVVPLRRADLDLHALEGSLPASLLPVLALNAVPIFRDAPLDTAIPAVVRFLGSPSQPSGSASSPSLA